jgi:hypothetical protein
MRVLCCLLVAVVVAAQDPPKGAGRPPGAKGKLGRPPVPPKKPADQQALVELNVEQFGARVQARQAAQARQANRGAEVPKIPDIQQLFESLDLDKSGTLNAKELREWYHALTLVRLLSVPSY